MEYIALRDCVINTASGPDHVKAGHRRSLDTDPGKHWQAVGGAPAAVDDAPASKPAKTDTPRIKTTTVA